LTAGGDSGYGRGMREVVLDTETTGLDPAAGDRIIEVGCVELHNLVPTGRRCRWYLNPERAVPAESYAVHGLSDAFLADKPRFAQVAREILAFIDAAPLVIHNAAFDLSFLNAELARAGLPPLPEARAVDTVQLARESFPGAPASLDALCRRFEIDLSERAVHGALKDAQLLAEVYLQLKGGREPALALPPASARVAVGVTSRPRTPRLTGPSPAEAAAHLAFIKQLNNPLWLEFA
jgi:DNA polymerase-3 subunit epsilon